MKAPLIFSSSSIPINVKKIFKLVLARTLELKPSIPEIHAVGHPLLEYTVWRLHGDHVPEEGKKVKERPDSAKDKEATTKA